MFSSDRIFVVPRTSARTELLLTHIAGARSKGGQAKLSLYWCYWAFQWMDNFHFMSGFIKWTADAGSLLTQIQKRRRNIATWFVPICLVALYIDCFWPLFFAFSQQQTSIHITWRFLLSVYAGLKLTPSSVKHGYLSSSRLKEPENVREFILLLLFLFLKLVISFTNTMLDRLA